MDFLFDFIDEFTGLDFFFKYSIIICNFLIIIALALIKRKYSIISDFDETKKNVLFITAHPDDEAMYYNYIYHKQFSFDRFFAPTIYELSKQYKLHLLCFTNGNADGLGKMREKELEKCCSYLSRKYCKYNKFIYLFRD